MPIDKALLERIANNDASLKEIELSYQKLGDADAVALAKALTKNTFVTKIDLSGNKIGAKGAKALAHALEINQSMITINLGWNEIGDASPEGISHALVMASDFGENNIGDEGAKALAQALEKNQSMTTIGLSNNRIGDEGARALAQALEKNQLMTTIDLWGNRIGDEGAKALAQALEKNQSMTTIGLLNNRIGDEVRKQINALLERNQALAKPYDEAKKAYEKALTLIREKGKKEEILAAFSTAKSKAEKGLKKSYPPSKFLLARIERDLSAYQGKLTKEDKGEVPVKQSDPVVPVDGQVNTASSVSGKVLSLEESKQAAVSSVDLQLLQRLQQLSQQQAALSTDEKHQASVHAFQLVQHQAELSKLQSQMRGVDAKALQTLQGREQELRSMIGKEQQIQLAEQERQSILSDESLKNYYHTFIIQIRDAWIACASIHSGKVDNAESNTLDKIPAVLDKAAEYVALPGVGLLKDVLTFGIKKWSEYDKKQAVNRMANFFVDLVEGNIIIETLARRLTLLQQSSLQVLGAQKKTGLGAKLKDLKNKATANDIDVPVKEKAQKDGKIFLEAIMQERLDSPATLERVDVLAMLITGIVPTASTSRVSSPPRALSPTHTPSVSSASLSSSISTPSQSSSFSSVSSPSPSSSLSPVTVTQSTVTSYAAVQQSLSLTPSTPPTPPIDAASKDELAALRKRLEEAEREAKEAKAHAAEAEARNRQQEHQYKALFAKVDKLSKKVGDDNEASGGNEAQVQLNSNAHPNAQNQLTHDPHVIQLSHRTDDHAVRLAMLEEAAGIQRSKPAEPDSAARTQLFGQ